MSGPPARKVVPWLAMFLVVEILAIAWLWLYLVNVDMIEKGTLTQVNRNTILDKSIVDYSGLGAALIVVAGVLYRARNRSIPLLIQEISQALRSPPDGPKKKIESGQETGSRGGWGTVFSVVFRDVLLLGRMGECEDFQQWLSHFLIMWGFIGLAVTTTLDAIINNAAVPLPITHPIRLLGNFTGIVFVGGLTLSIARRLLHSDVRTSSKKGDWAFLVSLYGTGVTGFIVQAFADTSNLAGTWAIYPVHLAFVAFLLVSAPWTKFVHALWRPSWVVYSRLNTQAK